MNAPWQVYPDLGRLFLAHLNIATVALLTGLALSLPLAVTAVWYPRIRGPLLAVISVVQTVPGLALLALMVPVLVMLDTLISTVDIRSLGYAPTVIALTFYSMLPMVRNTVTGIMQLDPAIPTAARALGMTRLQALLQVELPLASPVIVAGVRTAAVWTVGTATLATPVGQECLGNYIFTGLHTRNWSSVIVGCCSAALMAVALDSLIGTLQSGLADRNRRQSWTAAGLLAATAVVAIGLPAWPSAKPAAEAFTQRAAEGGPEATVRESAPLVVASKTFSEQYILAEAIAMRLADANFDVARMDGLGSTVIFEGLATGQIDCYVDYTGTIWSNFMKRHEPASGWRVAAEVSGWLAHEHGIRALGTLGFENAYALAMRREDAQRLGITSISDLAQHAAQMRIGGDYEFFSRPEWDALQSAYRLGFEREVSYDSTFMYEALMTGDVDVIAAFSSDGRIAAYDLVVLADPRRAIPPYDAILLLSNRAADDSRIVAALEPLVGRIPVEVMRSANYRVDRDREKQTVAETARWLLEQVSGPLD